MKLLIYRFFDLWRIDTDAAIALTAVLLAWLIVTAQIIHSILRHL